MSSLLDYYNNEFAGISLGKKLSVTSTDNTTGDEEQLVIIQKTRQEHDGTALLFAFYLPFTNNVTSLCKYLVDQYDNWVEGAKSGVGIIGGLSGDINVGACDPVYLRRIYVYSENEPTQEELKLLDTYCKGKSIYVTIRSQRYLNQRMSNSKPMAFISHDSRDQELIVTRLATGLISRLCNVWYSECSLSLGDSLRESIEKGIKQAHKCILVLTPNFLNNPGWTKKEFNSIFTREMIKEEQVIIPVWYNVTKHEVYEYSPALADVVAAKWPDPTSHYGDRC